MDLWTPHLWLPEVSAYSDSLYGLTMMARTSLLNKLSAAGAATPPSFVAVGSVASGSTSATPAYHAGVAANDIAFLFAHSNSIPTLTDISGWTGETQVNNGNMGARIYWKRLVGSESGTVSVTATGGANTRAVIIGIHGAIISGTPYEGYGSNTGGAANSTSASIVTTVANTLALRFCGCDFSNDTTDPAPTNYTERLNAGPSIETCIDERVLVSAGTEASSSRATDSSANFIVLTLAVKPA